MNSSIAHVALWNLQAGLAGRYALERELGRGGMAIVFLARDLEHDRAVAVKVLLPELAMALGTERFLLEIEVTRALRHARIVGVLDSGRTADGTLYYVMPFVEGGSLRDRLRREVQLPIDDAISITRQVADAIGHAHGNGVIHRDIKPENILFDANGALVADFGVARALSVAGAETLTRTGMAVGTPVYMSPEQAVGTKDVTPASDVYSLACVLYEMLAGQPPFTGPTRDVVITRHVLDTPPNLRIMRAGVSDAIEDAISRAMAKSPADRFRTVTEFAAALTDHEGTARRRREKPNVRSTVDRRSARLAWWRRPVTHVGIALSLAIVAGGAWLGWRSRSLSRPREDLPRTSIAVLYFDDRSPAKTLGDLANGLTEGLMRQLDEVPRLDVASRNGSWFFRGQRDAPVDSIARTLKAGTLLTGRVTPVGANARVDVELWDGTTGWRVGRRRIEMPRVNAIALQDSLARAVTRLLRKRIGDPTLEVVSRPGTPYPAAWDAMLRARSVVLQFDSLRRAGATRAAVRKAAEADSITVAAQDMDESWDYWAEPDIERARLAYAWARLVGASDSSHASRIDSGLAHAEAAVELAPNDKRALEIRGTLRYWRWLNNLAPDSAAAAALLLSAEQDLTAAASRERSQAGAWNALSHLRLNKGQFAKAGAAAERALELDPFLANVDFTIHRLFLVSLDLGYTDQASRWCDEGRRRFPSHYRFAECGLWLHALPGSQVGMTEAWKRYTEYVAMSPRASRDFNVLKGRMLLALAAVRAGLPDSATHLASAALGDSIVDPQRQLVYLAAIVHAQLGDTDEAIHLIGRFIRGNPVRRASMAKDNTWWLRELRSHPRYQALFRRRAS